MRRAPHVLALVASTAILAATGCAREPRVARVYDGQLVEGRFIGSDAYAAYLAGALAEASGDLVVARAAYTRAIEEDQDDPELEARLGEVECRLDPAGKAADAAFAAALRIDASSAAALGAQARCELARGHAAPAKALADRAAQQDPRSVALASLAITADGKGSASADPAMRAHAVELTKAHGENVAAWDALLAWGWAKKDTELVAQALVGLVRVAPARSPEVEQGALALAEGGNLELGRRLAAAVADAPRVLGVVGPRDPAVARLAVDEALARGDETTALARAIRGHVSRVEVAARALLLERPAIATSIVTAVLAAEPRSSGALMVKQVAKGRDEKANAPPAGALANPTDEPPEACVLLYLALFGPEQREPMRKWLARVKRTPSPAHDTLAGGLAVVLVSRGMVTEADLSEPLVTSLTAAKARASR